MIEVRGVSDLAAVSLRPPTGCADLHGHRESSTCAADHGPAPIGRTSTTTRRTAPSSRRSTLTPPGVTAANPMFVIVTANDDIHAGCSAPIPAPQQLPPARLQRRRITAQTQLGSSQTFGSVDFAQRAWLSSSTTKIPSTAGTTRQLRSPNLRRGGILDDLVFFIDNTDASHPALAQGIAPRAASSTSVRSPTTSRTCRSPTESTSRRRRAAAEAGRR